MQRRTLLLLSLLIPIIGSVANAEPERPDPARFDKAIATFLEEDARVRRQPNGIVFVGSSSIRLWKTAEAFPELPIINRGFGGSWLQDSLHFADKIIVPYQPSKIVIYAGDNDVNGELKADAVYADYLRLVTLLHDKLPKAEIIYIAIKPSVSRWALWPEMQRANKLIAKRCEGHALETFADIAGPMLANEGKPDASDFVKDGLHLSAQGYAKWNKLLKPLLEKAP